MMASTIAALRMLGKAGLLSAGVLVLMVSLVNLPDVAQREAVPSNVAKPAAADSTAQPETSLCLNVEGM